MFRATRVLLCVVPLLALMPAWADDLTGKDEFVCAAAAVVLCMDDGECAEGEPAELNVPRFMEVDLKRKRTKSTEASGENRTTPITRVQREQGQIVFQEHEADRAASFMISEETGRLTVAVAADDFTVSIFGDCTPMPSSR